MGVLKRLALEFAETPIACIATIVVMLGAFADHDWTGRTTLALLILHLRGDAK